LLRVSAVAGASGWAVRAPNALERRPSSTKNLVRAPRLSVGAVGGLGRTVGEATAAEVERRWPVETVGIPGTTPCWARACRAAFCRVARWATVRGHRVGSCGRGSLDGPIAKVRAGSSRNNRTPAAKRRSSFADKAAKASMATVLVAARQSLTSDLGRRCRRAAGHAQKASACNGICVGSSHHVASKSSGGNVMGT